MTTNPESADNTKIQSMLQKQEPDRTSLRQDLVRIGVAGAVGGVARKCWQIEEPIRNTPERANIPPTFFGFWLYAVPLNLFLGGVSAVIGVSLLAGILNTGTEILGQERFRIVGLSLICGLFFPTVFDLAADSLQASSKIARIEEQKTEVVKAAAQNAQQTAIAAEKIATSSNDPQVQAQAIQVQENAINNAERIATSSNNPQVQKQAIQVQESAINNAEQLTSTPSNIRIQQQASQVQENAIRNIERIAISARDIDVEQNAISQLAKIVEDSTEISTATQALDALVKVAIFSQEAETKNVAEQSLRNLSLSPQTKSALQSKVKGAISKIQSSQK